MRLESVSRLLSNLRACGYTVVGPRLLDGVVCFSEVSSYEDVAKGVLDIQSPGRYRIETGGDKIFSAVNGPLSVKTYLHPGEIAVAKVSLSGGRASQPPREDKKYAFFGIRPCDISAVRVLDRALMMNGFEERTYVTLRRKAIFIVVNCGRSGDNCFCASVGTGPQAKEGFDIALTELPEHFLVEISEECMPLLQGIDLTPATVDDVLLEQQLIEAVVAGMRKKVGSSDPASLMYEGLDSSVWEEVAQRCLSCGNCTMVCPTCFCNTTRDVTNLSDGSITKIRLWDSCLSKDFTYSAGGNPRRERKARYRQFVMHKFAYWTDQFELYGCVGCGRCITWCPVGIDITDTVNRVLRGQTNGGTLQEVAKAG